VAIILEMIKFEHTVFALPFALIGALLAGGARGAGPGLPGWRVLGWILVAMVGARSSAMAFNRLVDLEFDRQNPRTANRALPTGLLTPAQVGAFVTVSIALFLLAAWQLNRLALLLAPVALLVILGYSYTKRFTRWSHLVLGLGIGIAPTGAWIAVQGRLAPAPILLSAAVMLWVAGFDVIYACQDIDFDREAGLYSLPSRLGVGPALWLSRLMHLGTVLLLAAGGMAAQAGPAYYAGVGFVALLLVYEQNLVRPADLSRVNAAFFTVNGCVSVGLLLFTAADVWLRAGFGRP
jgi:4-hydroxybenzoate polyprenyltransferase